ncbi:MAG: hypothetical protein ABIM99_05945 [Candidatus Dojkabacteria bacterium]
MQHVLEIPKYSFSLDTRVNPINLDLSTIETVAKLKKEAEVLVNTIEYSPRQIETFLMSFEFFLIDAGIVSKFGLKILSRQLRIMFQSKSTLREEEKTFMLHMFDRIVSIIMSCDESRLISESVYEGVYKLSEEFEETGVGFPFSILVKSLEIRKQLLIKIGK